MTKQDEVEALAIERDMLKKQLEQERAALAQRLKSETAALVEQVFTLQAIIESKPSPEELSSNFYWMFGKAEVFNVQSTVRGMVTPEQIRAHIASAVEAMRQVVELGGHAKQVGRQPDLPGGQTGGPAPQPAPPPVPSMALEAVKDGTPEAQAAVKAVVEGVGDPPAGKEWQTVDICFVKILPQPGELVNIEFYGNSHKQPHDDFPEVKVNKWKYEQAAGLMKHVTSASIKEANEFALPCRVFYTIGKEYQKKDGSTGNYRDIGHVRLIE